MILGLIPAGTGMEYYRRVKIAGEDIVEEEAAGGRSADGREHDGLRRRDAAAVRRQPRRTSRRRNADRIEFGRGAPTATGLHPAANVRNDRHKPRITVEPGKMGGQTLYSRSPLVYDLASYLASDMTEEEILCEFPYLEKEDFKACPSCVINC